MIKLAMYASSILNGIAYTKSPYGNTPRLPITTHIKTKPTNQENRVVCSNENFLEIIKIAIANSNDQRPQIAPLMGSEGNVSPSPL